MEDRSETRRGGEVKLLMTTLEDPPDGTSFSSALSDTSQPNEITKIYFFNATSTPLRGYEDGAEARAWLRCLATWEGWRGNASQSSAPTLLFFFFFSF